MNQDQTSSSRHQPSVSHQRLTPPVVIGDFKVLYRPGHAFENTRLRLTSQNLHVRATQHFLFARLPDTQKVILVHQLAENELDNNIGQYLVQELGPCGLLNSDKAFGAALIGVVNSFNPRDPVQAWGTFSINTLQRLREKLNGVASKTNEQDFIAPFAEIYRYLFSLKVGSSLLDVGCACAFWPLLVAEREKGTHGRIVGVDNRSEAIILSENMAALAGITGVEFAVSDLLAPDFPKVGTFDTVTAIHLLEHFTADQLPLALSNLLSVTRQRLIIAVPYEQQAEVAYGHQQVFSREKLEKWGKWCVEQMSGRGRSFCEDVMGGILTVERHAERV